MLALQFSEYGSPDVLTVTEAAEPHAGPGTVRIAVRAASVNPFDWKVRAGYLAQMVPTTFPAIPGSDASGVVDEVGDGVTGVEVGDAVFGLGSATSAQYAVLSLFARKPEAMPFTEAAGVGLAAETATRALGLVTIPDGGTLLVDGAAGGVGSALVQLARARGLTVLGTASPEQHDYLRDLGATPTTYGEGLAARVAALAPDGVDAAVDVVGKGSAATLVEIVGDPARVATVADFGAAALGVQLADASRGRAVGAFDEVAALYTAGEYRVEVAQVFPLAEGAAAHALSEAGHVRGKLVLEIS